MYTHIIKSVRSWPNHRDISLYGLQNTYHIIVFRAKLAMNDPEIQQILQDPFMQVILEQMQKDPAAAQEWVTFNWF